MILQEGDKVLAVHRRLFERDSARFFIGVVEAYEAGIARVSGHTYVRDQLEGKIVEKEGRRVKILAVASGTLIVYRLPETVDLLSLRFETGADGASWLKDRAGFHLNLGER